MFVLLLSSWLTISCSSSQNNLTGEHTCIMLRLLNESNDNTVNWLQSYWLDFRCRFISLMSYQFSEFMAALGLSVLQSKFNKGTEFKGIPKDELDLILTKYDLKRLDLYSRNMVDYHLIMDLLPQGLWEHM